MFREDERHHLVATLSIAALILSVSASVILIVVLSL